MGLKPTSPGLLASSPLYYRDLLYSQHSKVRGIEISAKDWGIFAEEYVEANIHSVLFLFVKFVCNPSMPQNISSCSVLKTISCISHQLIP